MSFRLWNLTQDHEVAISRIRDLNQQNCYDLTESQRKQLNIELRQAVDKYFDTNGNYKIKIMFEE